MSSGGKRTPHNPTSTMNIYIVIGGYNQGGDLDTYSRYIYLHGTPDTVALGVPGSRGCVRMRNAHIIELFDSVAVGCPVLIR